MRLIGALAVLFFSTLLAADALALTADPFGPNGEGGAIHGQSFTIGPGGAVFEVDGFVNIAGQDLNGGEFGTAAQLSVDPLPAGLDTAFASEISIDTTDITLSYSFTNNTGSDLTSVTFISFLDAEIDESVNTFFNELATTDGALAVGQNFEADEPGFLFGDIFDNARLGSLDGTNAFPPADDVSMALSHNFDLAAGETATIDVFVSEDGDAIGTFTMTQSDTDPQSTTEITYSSSIRIEGAEPGPGIPEPGSATLFTTGVVLVGRALRRGRRQPGA